MNKLKELMKDYKFWIGVCTISVLMNMGLGVLALHYHNEAREEFNSLTVSWHRSNSKFCPAVSFPGVCYEKEIIVDGNEKKQESQ